MFPRLYTKLVYLLVGITLTIVVIYTYLANGRNLRRHVVVRNAPPGNTITNSDNNEATVKAKKQESHSDDRNQPDHLSEHVQNQIKTLLFFIGYGRSGHTLIGSLLDAHPHIVIANELNIFGKWQNWTTEQRTAKNLFNALYKNSRTQSKAGFRWKDKTIGRTYHVPNQWQGRFNGSIKIIGDKKGGVATKFVSGKAERLKQTFTDLTKKVKIPIKMVHVVRNPFDNIATMIRRDLKIKKSIEDLIKNPIENPRMVEKWVDLYFYLAFNNQKLLNRYGENVLTLYSENVIKNPMAVLERLCRFLDVTCIKEYLKDCASIIYKKPSRTRHTVVWPKKFEAQIKSNIRKIPFLGQFYGTRSRGKA